MEDHLFASRHDWYRHELEAHRSTWQCIPGCTISFSHASDYENHVSTAHPELSSSLVLAALRSTARKAGSTTAQANCPMCMTQMAVWALQHHIGRHQEELARFALASHLGETDNFVEDNSAHFHCSSDRWLNAEAVALIDFEGEDDDELKIVEGQRLWIAYRHEQGWVVVRNLKTGESGLVPEGNVRLLQDVKGGKESVAINTDVKASIERTPSAAAKITDRAIDRERRRKLVEDEKKRREEEEEDFRRD